jgi:hypothetical protein
MLQVRIGPENKLISGAGAENSVFCTNIFICTRYLVLVMSSDIAVEWIVLIFRIEKVLGSNTSLNTGYSYWVLHGSQDFTSNCDRIESPQLFLFLPINHSLIILPFSVV